VAILLLALGSLLRLTAVTKKRALNSSRRILPINIAHILLLNEHRRGSVAQSFLLITRGRLFR
jgi:hypothetical protein